MQNLFNLKVKLLKFYFYSTDIANRICERGLLKMDIFRTDRSSDIDFEPKVQQRRIKKASQYSSNISSSRKTGDHLTLSESAMEFKEIKGMLENVPEIRQDKVMELKEKIKQDDYQVDSEQVAEEILMEELTLARFL